MHVETIEAAELTRIMNERPTVETRVFEHALDISERAFVRMGELGLTQADLARKMGKSRARVSRLLSAQANMTLRSISELEDALDIELVATAGPGRADGDVKARTPPGGVDAGVSW